MAYMLLILEERGDRQARGVEQGRVVMTACSASPLISAPAAC